MPYERRQGNIYAVIALMVTLLTNIVALTWGASKMSSAITNLEVTTRDLSSAVKDVQAFNQRMDVRMTVAEKELDGLVVKK